VFVSWIGGGGAVPTNGVGGPFRQVRNHRRSLPSPRGAAGRERVGGAATTIALIVGHALARRMRIRSAKLARHLERPPPVPSPPRLRRGGRGTQALARFGDSRIVEQAQATRRLTARPATRVRALAVMSVTALPSARWRRLCGLHPCSPRSRRRSGDRRDRTSAKGVRPGCRRARPSSRAPRRRQPPAATGAR
jgi:hypothetical protein